MARSYKRRLPVQQCEDGYWSSGPCHLYKRGTFGLADTKKDGHWYCDVCLRNPHRDERGRFTARTPYKRLYYPAETHDLKEIYDLAGASRSHLDPSHQNGIANQNYLTARIRHLRKKAGIKGSVCDREFFREPFKKSYAYRFSILDNPQYCSRFLLYKGRMDFWEQSKYRFLSQAVSADYFSMPLHERAQLQQHINIKFMKPYAGDHVEVDGTRIVYKPKHRARDKELPTHGNLIPRWGPKPPRPHVTRKIRPISRRAPSTEKKLFSRDGRELFMKKHLRRLGIANHQYQIDDLISQGFPKHFYPFDGEKATWRAWYADEVLDWCERT